MADKSVLSTKLKKGDQVMIISGKEKGKTGRIIKLNLEAGTVLVEGINMVKKAIKKKRQEDQAGIIDIEAPLHISNVQIMDKAGKPVRIASKIEGSEKIRVSAKTGDKL